MVSLRLAIVLLLSSLSLVSAVPVRKPKAPLSQAALAVIAANQQALHLAVVARSLAEEEAVRAAAVEKPKRETNQERFKRGLPPAKQADGGVKRGTAQPKRKCCIIND